MGISRSAWRSRRRADAAKTKLKNRVVKMKERARREARMRAKLQTGTFPYTPSVMNWLSQQLGKRASKITPAEVQTFLG